MEFLEDLWRQEQPLAYVDVCNMSTRYMHNLLISRSVQIIYNQEWQLKSTCSHKSMNKPDNLHLGRTFGRSIGLEVVIFVLLTWLDWGDESVISCSPWFSQKWGPNVSGMSAASLWKDGGNHGRGGSGEWTDQTGLLLCSSQRWYIHLRSLIAHKKDISLERRPEFQQGCGGD